MFCNNTALYAFIYVSHENLLVNQDLFKMTVYYRGNNISISIVLENRENCSILGLYLI